jgi:Fur family iron response transcriptional regulator
MISGQANETAVVAGGTQPASSRPCLDHGPQDWTDEDMNMMLPMVSAPRPGEGRSACVTGLLRKAGLRPTRQRIALAAILFGKGDRHVSAEALYEEAVTVRVPVSLATVYNTLHQFTEAGLLRELAVDGSKSYFDTNVHDHHHFFVEGENTMMDVPASAIGINALPEPPEGYEIDRVDVLVRIKRKGS